MHSGEGWQDFRANYGGDMFRYLASTYPKAPWILASATLDDDCIHSIIQELGTKRWASHTCMFYSSCITGTATKCSTWTVTEPMSTNNPEG